MVADLGRLYSDEIFPVQPKLDGVWYPVLDTPGLGVEIDVDVIKALPVSHSENPHPMRPDGSVTNY